MELAQLSEHREKDMKAGEEAMKKLQDGVEKLQIEKQVGVGGRVIAWIFLWESYGLTCMI